MANADINLIRVDKTDVENGKSEEQASSWNLFRRAFQDKSMEKLYQSYSKNQKDDGLKCFLVASMLYDMYYLVVPCDLGELNWFIIISLLINSMLFFYCLLAFTKTSIAWKIIPHISWVLFVAQILISLFFKTTDVTARDNLGWVVVMDYLLYIMLPFSLTNSVLLSVGICTIYTVGLAVMAQNEYHLIEELCANLVLLLAANILGLSTFFLSDKQQRRAFLETRQSLEMKMLIEEQSAEQERLLLSVLPRHVAVRMRQDLGTAFDSQFKKIYMSRHENVSILYADIVGFTAISSTYSASELVKILNELFARFDKLSEKYKQLRIKILGDCYYCISGAPKERPDHAVLCVHMGLSMVKAIKYVQQTCNSPVDMRVGIHTGAVLAGVLGQRQWQFDVYSKDVELANKMESSGQPGRVHISEKTLSFLNGEFEVEPAYGERREEALRQAGIKTYFIVKVLKPFRPPLDSDSDSEGTQSFDTDFFDDDNIPSTSAGARGGAKPGPTPGPSDEPIPGPSFEPRPGTSREPDYEYNEENNDLEIIEEESQQLNAPPVEEKPEDIQNKLRKELINKGGFGLLDDHTNFFSLSFNSKKKEKDFNRNKEATATIAILGCPVVLLFISLAQFIILPRDGLSIASFILGLVVLVLVSVTAIAELKPSIFPDIVVRCSEAANDMLWVRRTLAALATFILGCINAADIISCDTVTTTFSNCTIVGDIDSACVYPSYFSYFCVLVLLAASLPTQISYLLKIAIIFFMVAIHCTMNLFLIPDLLNCETSALKNKILMPNKYAVCSMLVCVAIALSFLARHVEKATRVLFLWKTEVEEQKEKARDMGSRNEALVYNILPPHVAAHFLGNSNRQHEELYSQSYAEVGVLFASMPNFSDFYSEESVNNQGLECLRFLNEVISDFDAILQQPKFQDIIKIKTIGSTYMAASGLNPSKTAKPDDPIHVRWAHLALLVEFAFEMKKALQSINEQSFNHFVLKMGINHGPITAGVIGARKPHYDIWGNSVNVASRMESTGKAGYIQVTEETCKILQHYGYIFEQRGLVAVKGKGQLMTYYLVGKSDSVPQLTVTPTIETYKEEEEDEEEAKAEPMPGPSSGVTILEHQF